MAADELDFVNRDPNNINDHLKVSFEDVFGEPEGAHSVDFCWKCSFTVFTCTKSLCYNIFTILCACPLSCCWAMDFAAITFAHVWQITPCLRIFMINCGCANKFCTACLQCCLGPIMETCGLCFSNIVVKNA